MSVSKYASFLEKLTYFSGGRVGVKPWTRRVKDSKGGNRFIERYVPTLRGRRFSTGPCGCWRTEDRAKRAGQRLKAKIHKLLAQVQGGKPC